jgi:hypothetical protein
VHHPHWNGRIIGLWGAAKVGKDTIQRHLGWPRAAFADRLKLDLAPIFSRLGLDLENPDHKSLARSLMVEYGRLGRIIDPDIWIRRLELPEDEDRVVITDVRYWNEIDWIVAKGGLVVKVERPGVLPANQEEVDSFDAIERELHRRHIHVPLILNDYEGAPERAAYDLRDLAHRHWRAAA